MGGADRWDRFIESMSTLDVRITYRPVRVGFVVREGQMEDLVSAARLAALVWGGIRNPIIPIGLNASFPDQLIKLFQIDVLHGIGSSSEIKTFIDRHQYLKPPLDLSSSFFYEDWATKRWKPSYWDVVQIISHYWDKEFKGQSSSNCALLKWDPTDDLSGLFSLIFGEYARDVLKLKEDYEDAFTRRLRSLVQRISSGEAVPDVFARCVTPLILTADNLLSYAGIEREDGIFIGRVSDFSDLVSFWNLRASGIQLVFYDRSFDKRLRAFVERFLAEIDGRPQQPKGFHDWIGAYYRNSEKEVRTSLDFFKPKKAFSLNRVSEHTWNGLNVKPPLFHCEAQTSRGIFEEKYDRPTLSFSLPEKPFESAEGDTSQTLVASIQATVEFEDNTRTLTLPYLPDLNEFYSRAIHLVDPRSIRVEQGGLGLLIKGHTSSLDLFPVSIEDLMFKIYERSGLKAQFSHPGLLAKQIIKRMGRIESCRVFKVGGVRKLLHPFMNREIGWREANKVIWDDRFQLFHDLYIEPRRTRKLTPSDVWGYLLKKKAFLPHLKKPWAWVPRGLRWRRPFECPDCGLKTDLEEKDFQSDWVCPFCDTNHYMPVYIGKNLRASLDHWRFSKSKLFSVGDNQEGSIPVILTILQLSRVLDFSHTESKWVTSLNMRGMKCELDFAFLTLGKKYGNQHLQMAIGECKSDSGQIQEDDILHLMGVKEILENSGIKTFLVFSKTGERFTEEEISRFKTLVARGINPVLFTRAELEPYHPYEDSRRSDTIPHPYPMNFEEMAENSVWLYLRN